MNTRALIAEFIGTFALIFVGILAIAMVANSFDKSSGLVGIALAHGLTIAVMVSATAAISGGHLNPAVTFALLLTRRIAPGLGLAYILTQLLGGTVGGVVAHFCLPADALETAAFGLPVLGHGISAAQGTLIEGILTFFLVFVIFGTAVDNRAAKVGGLFIGLTVTLDILAGGPLTGAAMNPARWFGAAAVARDFSNAWVYIVGPVGGALVAALVYSGIMEDKQLLPPDAPVRTVNEGSSG